MIVINVMLLPENQEGNKAKISVKKKVIEILSQNLNKPKEAVREIRNNLLYLKFKK